MSTSETPQSMVEIWLKGLGFSRGNPFATVEADQEREFLPDFFVDVDGYELIKSDKTVIVFAPRGAGKSALRVELASEAAPILPISSRLAIEYTDFDELLAKYRQGQNPTIEHHVERLLRVGAQSLLNALCGMDTTDQQREEHLERNKSTTRRAAQLSTSVRLRLAHFLRRYSPALISPEALLTQFEQRLTNFTVNWMEFLEATQARSLHWYVEQQGWYTDTIMQLLADLSDMPDESIDSQASPTEKIAGFVQLVKATGFDRTHFLVDRLDEYQLTANNPYVQADILEPLLAHLAILETEGVAFKFFLSREARDILLNRPTIRRDRLTDRALTVVWSQERLKHLLDERLSAYSNGEISELIQICEDTRVNAIQEQGFQVVGEWLESAVLQAAQGIPRKLLVACQLLCEAHVVRYGPNGLFVAEDWEAAKRKLAQKLPTSLRLWRSKRVVVLGAQEVQLTPQQHEILTVLADKEGQCSREELVNLVWGTSEGVTEQAIDQAIGRLRTKLGDDPDDPLYLVTERGKGFRLMNFEVEE